MDEMAVANAIVEIAFASISLSAPVMAVHPKFPAETVPQVGQPLFLRNAGRAPALSNAGRSFLAYAKHVLAKSKEASAALSRIERGGDGQLTIVAQRCIANHLLPPVLTGFLKQKRACQIRLVSEIQETVYSMVSDGAADLGLFLGLQRARNLPSQIIGHQPLAIVVGAEHELARREWVTPQELAAHAFIGGLQGSHFARMIEAILRIMGIRDAQFILWMQDATALKTVARDGVGVLCTLICNVEDDVKSGALRMLATTIRPQPLQVRMALPPPHQVSAAAQRFAEYLQAVRLS